MFCDSACFKKNDSVKHLNMVERRLSGCQLFEMSNIRTSLFFFQIRGIISDKGVYSETALENRFSAVVKVPV